MNHNVALNHQNYIDCARNIVLILQPTNLLISDILHSFNIIAGHGINNTIMEG